MDLTAFADALQQSGISEWMRGSLKALPIIEAIHVMAVATVFGTIFIVDLRLLGYRDMARPFTRVFGETMRWTWAGFGLAVVTGALLFLPNARTYVANTAFALKMLGLVGAGINMAVFRVHDPPIGRELGLERAGSARRANRGRDVDPDLDVGDRVRALDWLHQGLRLHGAKGDGPRFRFLAGPSPLPREHLAGLSAIDVTSDGPGDRETGAEEPRPGTGDAAS